MAQSTPTTPEAVPVTAPSSKVLLPGRLISLDALRGFDLLWILGADSIGGALAGLQGGPLTAALARQLNHVDWEGFRFYDLIFPLFVFMVGVSLVFSLTRIVVKEGKDQALQRIVKRSVLLYLFGVLIYNADHGGYQWQTAGDLRLLGVLQRIAICYFVTGLLFVFCRTRTLVALTVVILAGYWALLTFVPAPAQSTVSFEEGKNVVNWFDSRFLPGRKWDGTHDPEGILSTLPAIATCLLGVFAGRWLINPWLPDTKKALGLLAAGVALLVAGYTWSFLSPIIKKLWTSPYVLVAGGWSTLLLAGFFWVIEILGWQRWAQPFVWIGMNPIALYLIAHLVNFDRIASYLVGGPVAARLDTGVPGLGAVGISVVGILLCVALARLLYVKKLFIRL